MASNHPPISLLSYPLPFIALVFAITLIGVRGGPNPCRNSNDFPCRLDNSTCIPRIKWQDGVEDCPDGSDEECLAWQYDCKFGKPSCVNLFKYRDGSIDCTSGFDEECPAHYFVCMDKSDCIGPKKYLDGVMDCKDGSDEPCPSAHFLCQDRSKCVHMDLFQDGKPDCPDGSDEDCTIFQFECLCGTPRCIPVEGYNDGFADCSDGSDEIAPDNDLSTYRCPDGGRPRNDTLRVPVPPPGAPMIPCGPDDLNVCSEELGEMCLIIAGAPRCLCGMGRIRPPGSRECVAAPPRPTPTPRPNQIPTSFLPLQDQDPKIETPDEKTPNLPVKKPEPPVVPQGDCDPDALRGCPGKNEVCARSLSSLYACVCRNNFTRDENGQCIELIDECATSRNNDCDPNAVCMDNPVSYECLCKEGFIDMSDFPHTRPGRQCLPLVNECFEGTEDCDSNAECLNLPGGYTCRCPAGFVDVSPDRARQPGRRCSSIINECADPFLNDCHQEAICTDADSGYQCRCGEGWVDLSPDPVALPGRICVPLVNECEDDTKNDCHLNADCLDTPDAFVCRCLQGYIDFNPLRPGRNCTNGNNPCLDSTLHDCDRNAICISNQPGFFDCRCSTGFVDMSPDNRFPGRKCQTEENECELGTHNCDPNAICTNTPESFRCECREGFEDASPDRANAPATVCHKSQTCALATCAREADCRETSTGPVCDCRVGYLDRSSAHALPRGHFCQELRNECEESAHDCSTNALCIDSPEAFLCRCHDGYQDESPDFRNPGRVCVKTFVPDPPECDVNDPLSCDEIKLEVCTFVNATYKCLCPNGIGRLPDGRCRVRNECLEGRLNDCSKDSQCIDETEEYTCQCNPGFADISVDRANRPGRICRQLVNECVFPQRHGVNCAQNAVCIDTEESFTCRCSRGFADVSENYGMLPGRRCVEARNECLNVNLHDCSRNGICEDAKEGFTCKCRDGYIDVSNNITHFPGRVCNKPQPPPPNHFTTPNPNFRLDSCDPQNARCSRGEICTEDNGRFTCQCSENAVRIEGICRLVTACSGNQGHDCDPNAICSNIFDSYTCQCRPGFLDISQDPNRNPGRQCKELVNECGHSSLNGCSPFAECIDTRDGYACQCHDSFLDVSSQRRLPPGRVCVNASNECAHPSLHTCSPNADCVDLPEGYACQCAPGFVDLSGSAHLPPGRTCTVQTVCPKQKTDLMFLIDGSGSIGSFIFRNEVLRFVREFVELFDIGSDKTRVGAIQYSDQIRHEFDLNQFQTKTSVLQGISDISYLTGLTRTGAAIQHMVQEGFSLHRGARQLSDGVSRVAIIITDGRSQDNVTDPAEEARRAGIGIFSIGVTDHVLQSELVQIAGQQSRAFHVHDFTDLDMRLRSQIQLLTCPTRVPEISERLDHCDAINQNGQKGSCDRTKNEICRLSANGNNRFECGCPDNFQRNPTTGICGGHICNPNIATSCESPAICRSTPYPNYRCSCPPGYWRHPLTGHCVTVQLPTPKPNNKIGEPECVIGDTNSCFRPNEICVRGDNGLPKCVCNAGLERRKTTGECEVIGSCDPSLPNQCDPRLKLQCLPHFTGRYHTCQCPRNYKRHPATGVCLLNECATLNHHCDRAAKCTDTDNGYICTCPNNFIDISPDLVNNPGRKCQPFVNECALGTHNCSPFAKCTDTDLGYICECQPGFNDFSPNPRQFPGLVCDKPADECQQPHLNDCHSDATCHNNPTSYTCVCNPGFIDRDPLRRPGRLCEPENDRCSSGNNNCHVNAVCEPNGNNEFTCRCKPEHKDRSPNPLSFPGRECIPVIPECLNPQWNDCDSPRRANCEELDDGYRCSCKEGYIDRSEDRVNAPGRRCVPLRDECRLGIHDCAPPGRGGICIDTRDSYQCKCGDNYLDVSPDPVNVPGRFCKEIIDECARGLDDCSPNADCIDTPDSYICKCPANFVDVSSDAVARPGRRCLELVDECRDGRHTCHPDAICTDTRESYRCQCKPEYLDESPSIINHPGRVCRKKLENECRQQTHDCSPNAVCLDREVGYTCRCQDDFLDRSPNIQIRPGRVCERKPTTPPPECQFHLVNSCNLQLKEVCRLIDGEPKCACPENYSRNPVSNACTVINECLFTQLQDCSPNAECIDESEGYRCECRDGYRDISINRFGSKPGRFCQDLVNECTLPHLNDCHLHAECFDKEEGFECSCKNGYIDFSPDPSRPGRLCRPDVDECADGTLNSCDQNADCLDETQGYTCRCRPGFLDISPTLGSPGRACRHIINECINPSDNDCDPKATCTDTLESYGCECPLGSKDISPNPAFPGRVCIPVTNECLEGKHDCDGQVGICRDTEDSFICECPPDYVDRSPNPLSRPGRVCQRLVDECATNRHTCHTNAECRDLVEGYTCECHNGFIDKSPNLKQQPGRVCTLGACPPHNNCSAAAVCEPQGNGDYTCICVQGYVDKSQAGLTGRVCVKVRVCRDPRLHECSRNAICTDLLDGNYRCDCIAPYLDRSPDPAKPGRICEPTTPPPIPDRNPCQVPDSNDCSLLGRCRSTGPLTYTCECPRGYLDRSPDALNFPGRICVPAPSVCLSPNQNDCHPLAVCSQVPDVRKFTCRCRDGYRDVSPDPTRSGRVCVEVPNECLDASLNDCDPFALCRDTPEGYSCHCPATFLDMSQDPQRFPGRKCVPLIDECQNPQWNNCSRFARCSDKNIGYDCQCLPGYSDGNPSSPGRNCVLIINECNPETPNLNDCDKNYATCIDFEAGFSCECRAPYLDQSPDPVNAPGRVCRFNECSRSDMHSCDPNAICQDTPGSYVCHCKAGFSNVSPDPAVTVCQEFKTPSPPNRKESTAPPGGQICGRSYCFPSLNEFCSAGIGCRCQPGLGRREAGDLCVEVELITLSLRVMRRNEIPLFWTNVYGNPNFPRYIEIVSLFDQGIIQSISGSPLGQFFVNTRTNFIEPPRLHNSTWHQGLIFNFSCSVIPGSMTQRQLWDQIMLFIIQHQNSVGGTELFIDPLYDPFAPILPPGIPCGTAGLTCDLNLGEICYANRVCGCPRGQGRRLTSDRCTEVEAFIMPLRVLRFGARENLIYNGSFTNPQDLLYQNFVDRFRIGVGEAYQTTQLWPDYVECEVNDIRDPLAINGTWEDGLLFNFTVYFVRGRIGVVNDVWRYLISSCMRNNYEIGRSNLFISPFQANPFSACFMSDCHPRAQCLVRGPNSYSCSCPPDFRDLNPTYPGRSCQPLFGYNECDRFEDNECGENSRCVNDPKLYHCECLPGFVDATPEGALAQSHCVINYCSDIDYCSVNTTCTNYREQARCDCLNGFLDIRVSPRREAFGLERVDCMRKIDVNECDLGLTNCSAVASCTDLIDGYTCECPDGWTDGNLAQPGRICGAILCDRCNQHGDCVQDADTRNVTCRCHDGWEGPYCDLVAAGLTDIRWILVIIFAILFLLLTCCCLLYFFLKCRCVKGRGLWYREPLFTYRKGAWPWSTLEASSSSESGAEGFSAMSSALGKASDYYPDLAIPRAKLAKREQRQQIDTSRLHGYLDEQVRIPRAKLSRSGSSVERSESEIFSDVHHKLPAGSSLRMGAAGGSDSETETDTSSEYTMREEFERRVITDVTKKETNRTIIADVHGNTTAEFHVYPPVHSVASGKSKSGWSSQFGGVKKEVGRKWKSVAEDAAEHAGRSEEQLRDEKEIYECARYPGALPGGAVSERDRGQSVTEVSVAGIQRANSDWGGVETGTSASNHRGGMSDYSERDLESISEESASTRSISDAGEDIYDKKVLVKNSRDWTPSSRGGTQRKKNQVTTTTTMKETKKY